MTVREHDLGEIVSAIWAEMLHLDVQTSFRPWRAAGSPPGLTGRVELSGAWAGTISVDCSRDLARRLAGMMFGLNPIDLTGRELVDAMGELANITGGNIKALLPGPSVLSIPVVTDDDGPETERPDLPLVARASFDCEGHPFWVIVRGRRAAD